MALDFDGSTDYLYTLTQPGYSLPFMVSTWIRPADTAANMCPFARINAITASNYHQIYISIGGGVYALSNQGINTATAGGSGFVGPGSIHHIFVAFLDATNRYVWVDGGNYDENHTAISTGAVARTSVGARLTAATPTASELFYGAMWDVAEWDLDSSPWLIADINLIAKSIYNGRLSALWYQPTRYWPFIGDGLVSWTASQGATLTAAGTPSLLNNVPGLLDPWIPDNTMDRAPYTHVYGGRILGGELATD